MNNKQVEMELIRIAKELLLTSKCRTSGMLKLPPNVVDPIVEWALGCFGASQAISAKEWIEHLQQWEGDEKLMKQATDQLKKGISFAKKAGVPLKKWKKKQKKFKVNTRGWKYESKLRSAPNLDEANKLYGKITVQLVNGFGRGGTGAAWVSSSSKINVYIGVGDYDDISRKIKHELIHWSQDYMNTALESSSFGVPGRKVRDFGVGQRNTKNEGDSDYVLDDDEFYPWVSDIIDRVDTVEQARSLLGAGKEIEEYEMLSFVKTMKSKNRRKWKRLVILVMKEL